MMLKFSNMHNFLFYKFIPYRFYSAIYLFILFSIVACGGNKNISDEGDFSELKELVESGDFEIQNDWAFPNNSNNINLIGNPNHLIFKNDSVDIFLPYFGVRHAGGNYADTEGGIVYSGPLNDLEKDVNETKGIILIKFRGMRNGEIMNFDVTLYPNKKARTRVVSTQRTPISYEGKYRSSEDL
ncbi:DUF4251 domain-containing protein [Gramella lutea]|uniref:DUF4251 domain-containing protein n=1 Tax=Christiangramia lutea TaxID=1607951 RepID=A0A9X1V2J9_9FLAO|nr:DUF4251 domain-containing protein [Christiangramia lutea]MCH4823110.1 DUF4251 domain-containing protein [Christiangramia lutea]